MGFVARSCYARRMDIESTSGSVPTFPDSFNIAEYYLDRRISEGRGAHTAVIDDNGSYSYAEVQACSEEVAAALWQAGVRPEDRCLLGILDSVEFVASFFGVLKAGGVVCMVNPELPDEDYSYYLRYTRCRALLVDAALFVRLVPLLQCGDADCLRVVIVVGELPDLAAFELPGVDILAFDALRNGQRRPSYPTHKDDPAVWLFTSGSTGKPKAAVHFHHDFAYNTETYAKQVLGMKPSDITLAVPKLYFGYATGTNLLFPFSVGATAVLYRERWSPEQLFDKIARHRVTVLTSVPTAINRMLDWGPDRSLKPLRVVLSAGEALPAELYHRFTATYGVEILDGIGSAELFHIYISNRFGEVRPGSLGRLCPGYEARVVRADGQEAEPGEIGTLWVRGDSAALCYWQAHEASKQTLRGDWVVSGDLFHRDAEGYFYYDGRADDLLKVGGIFVSPLEVEAVLLQHEAVLEVAVVGEENQAGLVKPLAYVVPKPRHIAGEALAEALVQHARARLAHYKAPYRIEFVVALPRSDRGKVLRRVLRQEKGTAMRSPQA